MDDDATLIGTDSTSLSAPRKTNAVPGQHFTPMLVCFEGAQRGERILLTKTDNLMGRLGDADIRVEDDMASRRHAMIHYSNSARPDESPECYLEDLGSRNGTELNGHPVTGAFKLQERDRILIGKTLFGFFLRDEGELQLEKSLFELATLDALTGLNNRHQFQSHLQHHVARSRRYARPVSLLIVDADHFKSVNDTYGHDVGDKVLFHIATQIRSSCRSTELCARWGGEEFAVLMPDSECRGALAAAERIRLTIESTPLRLATQAIFVTVSIGGAELKKDETEEEFFRRTDQQLLKAKEGGRNRVSFDMDMPDVSDTVTFGHKPS